MLLIITYYSYLKFELNSSHHHHPDQLQVEVSESLSLCQWQRPQGPRVATVASIQVGAAEDRWTACRKNVDAPRH